MEDGLFTNQGKKLLFVAIFLVLIAALVGGEKDPGMIAQVADPNAAKGPSPDHSANSVAIAEPEVVVRAPRRVDQEDIGNTSLESWYAEAAPSEPVDPEPVDESYLVNDTEPAVSAEPQLR